MTIRDRQDSGRPRKTRLPRELQQRGLGLEPLEMRAMLSLSPNGADPPIEDIVWNGQPAQAYAGRWVAGIDNDAVQYLVARFESGSKLGPYQFRAAAASAGEAQQAISGWLSDGGVGNTLQLLQGLGQDEHKGLFSFDSPNHSDVGQLRSVLGQLPGFRYIEPDFVLSTTTTTPNDSLYSTLWGMNNMGQTGGVNDADIDAPEAWDLTTGSSDVVVGVIDTGVDYTHPDLAANIWTNPGEIAGDGIDNDGNGYVDDIHGWDFVNDDNDPMDDNDHGTHVSGTIGGVGNNGTGVVGVNWNVRIMALKYLNAGGHGSTSNAIHALNYATAMRRDHGINIRLTSNSWGGGGFSQGLYDAIANSGDEDMLFIAAAGNGEPDGIGDDNDLVPFYPATYELDNIISVAATNDDDDKAGFSNFGSSTVDLGAPGVSVRSTIAGGGYANFNGTSMATPHVAGVAALALSIAPDASASTIKAAILGGVDPIPALTDITVTGGRLNAFGTLQQLGMRVASTNPAKGSVISTLATDFTVNFSNPYVVGSIDATDLTVNGIAADSFTLDDADSVTFHFNTTPISAQGLQTMVIAGGAVTRLSDSAALAAYSGTFRYDVLPMTVTSTVPANGTTASLPLSSIQVNLNEAYDPATVSIDDLVVSQGTVTSFTLGVNSITYNIVGLNSEGVLSLSMKAGALTDAYGNPLVAYSGSVTLDYGDFPFPAPLSVVLPEGNLQYNGQISGSLSSAADVDNFTISLTAGQALTVVVDPAAGLRPTIELRDPTNTLVASASASVTGQDAVLQTYIALTSGTFKFSVGSAAGTSGSYTVQATLNGAAELESHNGSSNNTLGTAQSLNAGFIAIGAGTTVAAVVGQTDTPLPNEIESNGTTGTANNATTNFANYTGNLYQLPISGSITTGDIDWFKIGAFQAGDVLSLTMSGSTSARGTLANPILELYRGNASSPTLVTSDDDNGPGSESLVYRYTITTTDTYYLRARPVTGTGTYQLAAWLENARTAPTTGGSVVSETESNNTAPTANDVSGSWRAVNYRSHIGGTIGSALDSDLYRYTFTAGDVVTIVGDSTSTMDSRLALLNSGGTVIASEDGNSVGPGVDSYVFAYRIATTGTYYMRVQARTLTGAYNADVYLSSTTTPPISATNDDWYSFSLVAGQRVSLALKNTNSAQADIYLVNAGGTTVATGVAATNADEMIHQYVAPATGTYYARVNGLASVDYSLVVLRDGEFDTESNDSPAGTLIDLTDVKRAIGSLNPNRPDYPGDITFTLDHALTSVTLSGDLQGTPLTEQTPGSLTTNYAGTIVATVKNNVIQFTGGSLIDADLHAGSFLPGNIAADYAGQIDIGGGQFIYGLFRNLVMDTTSGQLPIDNSGQFAANKVTVNISSGILDYSLPGFAAGTYDLAGLIASNETTDLATLTAAGGILTLNIPINGSDSIIDPTTGLQFNLALTGQVVASVAQLPPIDAEDYYQVTLAAGESVSVRTSTPLDTAGAARLNTLDPELELLDASNAVVASDLNSAGDGKNAALQFTSLSGGTYKIHVRPTSGQGEYLLDVSRNRPPVLNPIGNQVVNEGDVVSFNAGANDPDLDGLTFSLGPGAPLGAAIDSNTGSFSWTAGDNAGSPFSITVIVTDNGNPQLSDSETIQVTVNNVAPTADAGGPYIINNGASLNLVGSGTDPIDSLTYAWDVNADGNFTDATGATPTLAWSQLQALGISAGTTISNLRVQVSDGTDTTTSAATSLNVVAATVAARNLFYNQSKYDGNSGAINAADDGAIATDKTAYLPGSGAATFTAVSSYTKGINGIMIDLAGPHAATLSDSDFVFRTGGATVANANVPANWTTVGATPTISIRTGAGVGGSDRVEITWVNNAIQKTWLEVIVKANTNTGLAQLAGAPAGVGDVFFWGNALGDSSDADATGFVTNANDELAARNHPAALALNIPTSNLYDYNRDGKVDASDQLAARNNSNAAATAPRFINIALANLAPQVEPLAFATDASRAAVLDGAEELADDAAIDETLLETLAAGVAGGKLA